MNQQQSRAGTGERGSGKGVPIAIGAIAVGLVFALFWEAQVALSPLVVVGIMALFLIVPAAVFIAIAARANRRREE